MGQRKPTISGSTDRRTENVFLSLLGHTNAHGVSFPLFLLELVSVPPSLPSGDHQKCVHPTAPSKIEGERANNSPLAGICLHILSKRPPAGLLQCTHHAQFFQSLQHDHCGRPAQPVDLLIPERCAALSADGPAWSGLGPAGPQSILGA